MAQKLDPVTNLVVMAFGSPGVALLLAGAILAFSVSLIAYSNVRTYKPLLVELRERWNLLNGLDSRARPASFYARFSEIDRRFSASASLGQPNSALLLGWSNYRSVLVENGDSFVGSVRAAEAFDQLDEPARALEWWANIMVAVGLVITFLGIVAALSEATLAMAGSPASGTMQASLMGLLAIAATKFWTSIAGVLSSIFLRLFARSRRRAIQTAEAELFVMLDSCLNFMPTEKVALEQLKALQRIEASLAAKGGA
ncbi:hypothetical protein [Asticcacaulis sp.]|uniref:hypothetical protein n=1 Tax=Asticcacaulis sp. TaxID=1872648 RepID=UPI00391BCF23